MEKRGQAGERKSAAAPQGQLTEESCMKNKGVHVMYATANCYFTSFLSAYSAGPLGNPLNSPLRH